jgi:hypothetical protein
VPDANGVREAAETQQLEVSCDDLVQHPIDGMPDRVHCPRQAQSLARLRIVDHLLLLLIVGNGSVA